ncbi:MAG: phosphate--AMP phosphotransferase, partial [Ruminococcus sp.]|nr:phosphate--AMP phosphotransferase [Ruminococcus sp.]
ALDPRGYEVEPIAAPDKYELARHYLYRFWTRLENDGHITIFDRTWYGRVMVEPIENITPADRVEQAYQEINEFEKFLMEWGAVVIKFWINIDKDEQLKRFTLRQNTPEKQWKITDEDWRNREKWDVYEKYIDTMIERTSTKAAPWTIIEGNDKKYARIKALKTIIEKIEQKLDKDK